MECYSWSAQTVSDPPQRKDNPAFCQAVVGENDCVIKELTGTVINVCFFNAFFHTYFIITVLQLLSALLLT